MAESGALRAPSAGWLEAIESRPWGFLGLGFGLSCLLLAGMLTWWAVFGFWDTLFDPGEPFGLSFDGRNHLTMAVLLGFVIAGTRWARRRSLEALRRVEARTTLSREAYAALIRRAAAASPAQRAVCLGAGLALGVSMFVLTSREPESYLRLAGWDSHHVWAIATNVVLFGIMFESAFLTAVGWGALDRVTRSLRDLDLLDREALSSVGRYGLPAAAFWLFGSTLASSLGWGMPRAWPVYAVICGTLALATAALIRPAQIVRNRVREAKLAELGRVRGKIAAAKEATLSNEAEEAALLPGLLAYEARIESVREWPFDPPTLLRFGALAVLAVGSWLGGALVERALTAVLE